MQDLQVAWTPGTLKLGEAIGFFTFGDLPGITSIEFDQVTSIAGFDIEDTTAITSLSWPNLVTVDPTQPGYIYIQSNTALVSVSLPKLQTGSGTLQISGNSVLTSVDLSSLNNWTNGVSGLQMSDNPLLTTVLLTNWIPQNGASQLFTNNALDAATVNLILDRCVSNPAVVSGIVSTVGGTNAAPTGQGITDKATLIARGVTVNTN
jgi:hypothetical protein